MNTIGLVSCSKTKQKYASKAQELYTSTLFKKALAYAEKHYDKVFILSAKYGLADLNQLLEPYDVTLKNLTYKERHHWGFKVVKGLDERGLLRPGVEIYFHAGALYRVPIITHLHTRRGIKTNTPLQGLGIGKQLAWYKERGF